MRSKMTAVPLLALLALLSWGPLLAKDTKVELETLTRWMADFNAGKTERVCDLFAAEVRADFRGCPTRDYQQL